MESSERVLKQMERQAEIHHDMAKNALERLVREAQQALADLEEGKVRTSIGGAALNQQTWQDAERGLTHYWLAAGIVATLQD